MSEKKNRSSVRDDIAKSLCAVHKDWTEENAIDKFLTTRGAGQSRRAQVDILKNEYGINIHRNTWWYVVKREVDSGRTQFVFDSDGGKRGRRKGQTVAKSDKDGGEKKTGSSAKPEVKTVPKGAVVNVKFHCQSCGSKHDEAIDIVSVQDDLIVKTHQCPACEEFMRCTAEFRHGGKSLKKAMIPDDGDGVLIERFVDIHNDPIDPWSTSAEEAGVA